MKFSIQAVFALLATASPWASHTGVEAMPKPEIQAAENAEKVCTYDYTLVQRVGGTTHNGLPIKILRQAGTVDGTVDFIIGNTWKTNSPNDSVDAIYAVLNDEDDGSKSCFADTKVESRKSIDSSLQAYCSSAGVALVRLFITDATHFANEKDVANVPQECLAEVEDGVGINKNAPGVEYMAILQCNPTCGNNPFVPNPDPFEIDVTKVPTLAPVPIPTPAPVPLPTLAPIPGDVVMTACPNIGDDPLVLGSENWSDGTIAEIDVFQGQDVLCTLVEMTIETSPNGGTTTYSNLKPIGRSYNGNDWEAAPGDFATLAFDCAAGSKCRVALPTPPQGRSYVLKSYDYGHDLTEEDKTARFLERATFGPNKKEIEAFTSPNEWIAEQFTMPRTSHRRFFRERATDWFPVTTRLGLVHTGPCTSGTRYRNFAMLRNDHKTYLEVRKSPLDNNKLILTAYETVDGVKGQVRTVVDGPMQYGTFKGNGELKDPLVTIPIDRQGTRFHIGGIRPIEGVGGRFTLSVPTGKGKKTAIQDIFFGGESGNPRVQFDDAHLSHLNKDIVTLPKKKYEEVMTQYYYEDISNVLQLTSDVSGSYCNSVKSKVTGFDFPAEVAIASTNVSGNTRYWLHSPTFDLVRNDMDAPLLDGGKNAVDLTANPPADIVDDKIRDSLKVRCSNVAKTFLNEESCRLTPQDACSYDGQADIDGKGMMLVCGSPDEVAGVHGLEAGTRGMGGFTMKSGVKNVEPSGAYDEQKNTVWAEIALYSKDQLAQRMAYALNQIFVVADETGQKDAAENYLSYYDM